MNTDLKEVNIRDAATYGILKRHQLDFADYARIRHDMSPEEFTYYALTLAYWNPSLLSELRDRYEQLHGGQSVCIN